MSVAHPPHNGTATSIAAAESVSLSQRMTDRKAICQYIASMGEAGAIDEEIQRALPNVGANSLRPRRGELVELGLVSSYLGHTRRTLSGRLAMVHHITALGLEKLGAVGWCCDGKATK